MAVANSISDAIPSILFGAPDEGSELELLPGQKMLMKGFGYDAIKLTVIGGIGAAIFLMLLLPAIFFGLPSFYIFIKLLQLIGRRCGIYT